MNYKLKLHERLGFLDVVTTTWTPENGFVTRTLKVKRLRIEEAFGAHSENWQKL